MNSQIYEEASDWVVEFRTGDVDARARQQFERWLGVSPEHVRAYLELTAVWEDASTGVDREHRLDTDALIAAAASETNVVSLQSTLAGPMVTRSRAPRFLGLAASVLLVLATAGVAAWFGFLRDPVYATEVAEQRSIRLEDGSTVQLSALSRVRVRFAERERRIELLSGQAIFSVAKAAGRPFVVESGATYVRALGTQFEVHRKRSGTVVTVLEGRVAVRSLPLPESRDPTPSVELTAGQQVTVRKKGIAAPVGIDVSAFTARMQQPLVFESTPLIEVAEEFNRYSLRPIIIDKGLEGFHISGTFPASDPATLPRFVQFLREQPTLEVMETPQRIVVSPR